jgi:hypothetical protein
MRKELRMRQQLKSLERRLFDLETALGVLVLTSSPRHKKPDGRRQEAR